MLRSISTDDQRLLAASFARLSEESRYRRFFTIKDKLSAAELDYFVDVDDSDHEAIIAIDPSAGDLLGGEGYIRSNHDANVAEVAVTVADDWQKRGLGRVLLDGGLVEIVIELPASRGIGARLAQALRAAAAGTLVPAHTLTHRLGAGTLGREKE